MDLPFLIYYLPSLTNLNIKFEDFNQLFQIKNVVGVKYSHTDLYILERLINKNPDKVFLFGVDELLMSATVLGIDGAIGSTYNLYGTQAQKIFQLTKENKLTEARELTKEYNHYLKMMLDNGVYQIIKQAVALQCGFQEIYCRMPLKQIDNQNKAIAQKLLAFCSR